MLVEAPPAPSAGAEALRRWRRPVLGPPLVALVRGWARPAPATAEEAIRESNPAEEVGRRDATFRRALACADMAATVVAVLLAVGVAGAQLRPVAVLALPLLVLAAKVSGLYDRDELLINKTTVDQAPQLFQLATLFTLLFFLLQGRFVDGHLAPPQIVVLWGATVLGLVVGRWAARAIAGHVTPVERVLFVGSEASGDRLREKLAGSGARAEIVGRMSLGDAKNAHLVAAAVSTLHRLIDDLRVHRVVIEPSEPRPQATLDFVREAKATGARVSLLPRILEVVGSSIEIDDVDGLTLLGVRQFGLSRSSLVLKRSFDVVCATAGLVLLAPMLGLIALLIRLDSPGPAIYRQTRVGRGDEPFTMWKFRTMVENADAMKPSLSELNEADGLFKISDDPRLTPLGRHLRRFSLDELPQLVNVLRGDMSLVGPRPLVRDDDARITGLDRRRLHLTPGMTGHWQILGSSRVPLPEMIKLDYLYIAGWSLWSDLKILLRTAPYVLARRGM
jgi:exopolysaccharide biosynthesis polyprenyl glycosylphosphotransferase